MLEVQENDKKRNMIENRLIPFVLFIISFYDFNRGIDLTDAGYSLHFYEFLGDYSGSDIIALFWSVTLGHFFSKLPWGDTWCGMSFYCTLIIALSVVTGYFFMKKYLDYRIVALCEALAVFLCWAPNVILYDYLSFFLFQIGIILVYKALESKKRYLYVLAGLILGINVFARIPNLTHCAAITLVWLSGWWNREKVKKIVWDTVCCIIGYVIGIGFSVLAILYVYDFSELRMAFYMLFDISQSQDNYGILYMATAMIAEVLKYWKYVLVLALLIGILTFIKAKLLQKDGVITKLGTCAVVLLLFAYWTKMDRLLSFDYEWLNSILGLACIFLLWGLIVSLWNLFSIQELKAKMLALTYIGIFYVTPLGSNTHINLVILNMFLIIPLGVFQIQLWGERLVEKADENGLKWGQVFGQEYRLIIGTVGCIMLVQTVSFGMNYIFRDTDECIIVEDNKLQGMQTSVERKTEMLELIDYFDKEELQGEYGISYWQELVFLP